MARNFCIATSMADGFPFGRPGSISCRRDTLGRIRHGVRIDPLTLGGEAGFYGDADANCCPSQSLMVDLALRGDALVLRTQPRVQPARP